jgi:hypothetical protein
VSGFGRIGDAVTGAFVGAGIGFVVQFFFVDEPWLFRGDAVVFGAVIVGILGLFFGKAIVRVVIDLFESISSFW